MRDDKKRRDIRLLLAPEPCLKTLEVLRERGYAGGKRAVYALVQRLRPRETRPLRRFEGLAGEFSQHDFGEMRVEFADGPPRAGAVLRLAAESPAIRLRDAGAGPEDRDAGARCGAALCAVRGRAAAGRVRFRAATGPPVEVLDADLFRAEAARLSEIAHGGEPRGHD